MLSWTYFLLKGIYVSVTMIGFLVLFEENPCFFNKPGSSTRAWINDDRVMPWLIFCAVWTLLHMWGKHFCGFTVSQNNSPKMNGATESDLVAQNLEQHSFCSSTGSAFSTITSKRAEKHRSSVSLRNWYIEAVPGDHHIKVCGVNVQNGAPRSSGPIAVRVRQTTFHYLIGSMKDSGHDKFFVYDWLS